MLSLKETDLLLYLPLPRSSCKCPERMWRCGDEVYAGDSWLAKNRQPPILKPRYTDR